MLEGIIGKVMAGLLSVSSLMFSSYTGNDPKFQSLQCRTGQNYLLIKARLGHAFDNDFGDVFRCGKPVNLMYKVEIRQNNQTVQTNTYRHTVIFNPMQASWEVFSSETSRKEIFTVYELMLNNISELECSIPRETSWTRIEIKVESWLLPIELTQPDRTVDLMMLWKFKRPAIKRSFTLPPIS